MVSYPIVKQEEKATKMSSIRSELEKQKFVFTRRTEVRGEVMIYF